MKCFYIENDLGELLYEDSKGVRVKKYTTWAHESEVENSFKVVKYSDYIELLEQAMKLKIELIRIQTCVELKDNTPISHFNRVFDLSSKALTEFDEFLKGEA